LFLERKDARDLVLGKWGAVSATRSHSPGRLSAIHIGYWLSVRAELIVLYFVAVACICRHAAGTKMEHINSAAGCINSRLRSYMRHSTLADFVVIQEWLKEIVKVIVASRNLMDLAVLRFSIGDADSSETESSSEGSD
jgi:hypothetical protein